MTPHFISLGIEEDLVWDYPYRYFRAASMCLRKSISSIIAIPWYSFSSPSRIGAIILHGMQVFRPRSTILGSLAGFCLSAVLEVLDCGLGVGSVGLAFYSVLVWILSVSGFALCPVVASNACGLTDSESSVAPACSIVCDFCVDLAVGLFSALLSRPFSPHAQNANANPNVRPVVNSILSHLLDIYPGPYSCLTFLCRFNCNQSLQ